MLSHDAILTTFVEAADTLVLDFDLFDFLTMLTQRAVTISGVDSAGILLADTEGVLQYMAASSERSRLLEIFQAQRQEGPCYDAFRTGRPVITTDLAAARGRWPSFAPQAVDYGFRSVHALPMRLRSERIGALNLFGTGLVELGESEVRVVQALADVATIAIIQERTIRGAEALSKELQTALTTRIIIEQAKGILAHRKVIGVDDAFEVLRAFARQNRQKIASVCDRVVNDPAALERIVEFARARM